jgi:2-methylcitrate dehydratase PrpD
LIKLTVEPEIEKNYPNQNGCRVLLTLADGSIRQGYVPFAQGEPEFPISDDQLRLKFDILSQEILPESRRDAIYKMCRNLETIENVGQLMALTVAN